MAGELKAPVDHLERLLKLSQVCFKLVEVRSDIQFALKGDKSLSRRVTAKLNLAEGFMRSAAQLLQPPVEFEMSDEDIQALRGESA